MSNIDAKLINKVTKVIELVAPEEKLDYHVYNLSSLEKLADDLRILNDELKNFNSDDVTIQGLILGLDAGCDAIDRAKIEGEEIESLEENINEGGLAGAAVDEQKDDIEYRKEQINDHLADAENFFAEAAAPVQLLLALACENDDSSHAR